MIRVDQAKQSGGRVEYVIAGITAAGFAVAASRWGWRMGVSFAVGAGISWINYRWLRNGVGALTKAATAQSGQPAPKIPKGIIVKLLGRFALLVVALYVILSRSLIPAEGLLAGLFVVVAAVLVEMIYLLSRGAQPAGGA